MGRLASAVAALSSSFAQGFAPDRAEPHAGTRETLITIIGQQGGWGRADDAVNLPYSEAFRITPWTHISVDRVASNVARLPLRVYQGDPEGDFRAVPKSNLAARLIANPNRPDSGYDFKYDLAMYLGINGEAPIALEEAARVPLRARVPKEMRVLDPEALAKPPRPGAPWLYTEEDGGGKTDYVIPESLIMAKLRDPKSRLRGLSPQLACWDAILQDRLAVAYQKRVLKNGSAVGYTMESDNPTVVLNDVARKEIREDFDSQMFGGRNKLFLSGRGLKLKELGKNNREMEYRALRVLAREEQLSVGGVPPAEVGILENTSKLANADVQTLLFWRNKIVPVCSLLEHALNADESGLFWRFGGEMWCAFDLSGVQALQEDPNSKTARVVSLAASGIYSPNKALMALGEEPETGNKAMDRHYIGGIAIDGEQDTQDAAVERMRRTPAKRASNFWADPDRRDVAVRLFDTVRNDIESGWRGTLRAYFGGQSSRFLDVMATLLEDGPAPTPNEILRHFSQADEREALSVAVGDDVRASVIAGIRWGNKMIARARKRAVGHATGYRVLTEDDFDADPATVDFIRNIEQKLAREVTATTWDGVKGVLQSAYDAGATVRQTTDALAEYFADRERWQTQRIARTETTKASNGGTMLAFAASGVVERKQWVSARDENVRGDHYATDRATSETPIPLDEDFRVGRDTLAYPGDPGATPDQTCNCRCVVVPVVEGE